MTLTKTKGADLFTIQTLVEMNEEDGIPMLMTRLAVAVRKKLFIFVWKDTEFLETKVSAVGDKQAVAKRMTLSENERKRNKENRIVRFHHFLWSLAMLNVMNPFARNSIYLIASKPWPGSARPRFVWDFLASTC